MSRSKVLVSMAAVIAGISGSPVAISAQVSAQADAAAEPAPAAAGETGAYLAADFAESTLDLPRCPDSSFANSAAKKPLRPAMKFDEPVEITSDNLHGEFVGDASARGNVEARQGDRVLHADELSVDHEKNSAEVHGKVEYRDPQLIIRGDAGSLVDGEAQFEGAQFELPLQPARGAAQSLHLDREGILSLEGVSYTTCPIDKQDWRIRADRISLNTKTRMGTAHDARVDFMGLTVFRLPVITFPVGDTRKSGLLFPTIGNTSRGGFQLAAPYYFNLAENYDLTLTPTIYSKRGLDMGGQFRYLTRSSEGLVSGNVLPSDNNYGDTRSYLKVLDRTELPGDWRLVIDAQNASDAQYFEDFAQGPDGTSVAFLPRLLQVSYRDPIWDAGVMLRNYQTIDEDLPAQDRPYSEVPRAYAQAAWKGLGGMPLEYGFESEASGFMRDAGVEGWRLHVMPRAALDVEGPGYFLRPAVAFDVTQYQLDSVAPGEDRSPNRSAPVVSLDGGLLFERGIGSRGQRRITLEPRMMYLYTPYRDQTDLPVFDTAVPDLNWVELFRTNRYVGLDRLGDANQISVGVTSRLFSSASGTRFLSATLGQTLYFETPRVLLPDEQADDRKSSDLIAQVELQAFKNWSVDMGVQWDHQQSRAEKSEVRLQFRPAPDQVINLGYRFQRDRLEQADFSVAWPISKSWRIYGRSLYSLRDKESIEQFAGFEYGSCCWRIRAVAREYVSRRSGERDSGVYIQMELKGLSSVGLAADAFLERAIRGYSVRGNPR
ncbi:MAG: LPS assembly protein LptD [Pseudomonadota bacterium]